LFLAFPFSLAEKFPQEKRKSIFHAFSKEKNKTALFSSQKVTKASAAAGSSKL